MQCRLRGARSLPQQEFPSTKNGKAKEECGKEFHILPVYVEFEDTERYTTG